MMRKISFLLLPSKPVQSSSGPDSVSGSGINLLKLPKPSPWKACLLLVSWTLRLSSRLSLLDNGTGCAFFRALTPWCALMAASKLGDLELVAGTADSLVSLGVGGGLGAGGGGFLEWSFYQDEGGEYQYHFNILLHFDFRLESLLKKVDRTYESLFIWK